MMWKILVGFIVFAAAALFFIFKAGDKVDMQGETGGHNQTEVHSSAPASTTADTAAPAPASDAAAGSK
ncbi:hypothetical protein [Undibacterium griseum]